jgi:hypothetical protein
MQTPSVIRTRPRAAVAAPAKEIPWSFMLLVIVCACVVAAGFFFAARQHFTSMDYGIKNSKLREQLQNLEAEKRRLLLAREVAVSPFAIRKAARVIGLRETAEIAAVQISSKSNDEKNVPAMEPAVLEPAKVTIPKPTVSQVADRSGLSVPVQPKPTGETRSRIVEPQKEKKDRAEVAALLKLK